MNQAVTNKLITNQDTVRVSREGISVKIPTVNQVNIDAPKPVSAIPETPKRFQTPKTPVKVKEKLFVPSAKDSIEFNLKTRNTEGEGNLTNTVVRDYLQPISRSDVQWIDGGVTGLVTEVDEKELQVIAPKVESDTLLQEGATDSLKNTSSADSLSFNKDTIISETPIKETNESILVEPNVNILEGRDASKDVLTGLLILAVAITGVVRLTNFKYLKEIFSAVVFSQYARKMQKVDSMRNQKAAFTLNALFLFNTALFIYEYVHYNNISTALNSGLLLIPLSVGIVLGFGLIKTVLYRFIAFVFECNQETNEYIFYGALYDKIFGIVILPIILVVPYIEANALPALFNVGIGIFILLYLIQLFRGLTIILKNVASLFYMFLYLCALEILPLVIMYNILVG